MNATVSAGRVLMCPPRFFAVDYVINPWMQGNVHLASPRVAAGQWENLRRVLSGFIKVEEITPLPGLPDMTFTANAGLVIGEVAVPSRFMFRQRRGEEVPFATWFREHGFTVHELPPDLPFEGAGDALLHYGRPWLWAAYGFRTDLQAHAHLSRIFEVEVLSLRLVDSRFYHLDTCLCPLSDGYALWYPAAFDGDSQRLVRRRVPGDRLIEVSEGDALDFACNAVNLGRTMVLNRVSEGLRARLEEIGFEVIETELTEFMKAGGSAKCLTLKLDESLLAGTAESLRPMPVQEVQFSGHLLDSGLLSRALDAVIDEGGSFQILDFQLGEARHSPSEARVRVTAPSEGTLETIMGRLLDLGGRLDGVEAKNAEWEAVTQDGVAPEDFAVTTIYPTEVRVNGHWVRVRGQRMDAMVVVETDGSARCSLMRELKVGDRVVVGVRGFRTRRLGAEPAGKRDESEEFGFMAAGVSSERRVEIEVEKLAWEMRRLRDAGAKMVVVAGPVVLHTGGGEHLARLVREGYVGALLAGNALAVHDVELAMFGTSLGTDLGRGKSVRGGHRHHLRAINEVRRCGSLAAAVEAGVLTSGIFYECVRTGVPFCLAGSIRDDGPLPDTEMDLLKAQAEYARLLQGSQLTLMLSSMLHSIGAGNMTPAGVKLVCVDINPAVVTKLADRGSLESTGIVTDVGLFLKLLVSALAARQ